MRTAATPFALSPPVNMRDLGGIAIEGGVIRQGFALRTDDLAYVTEAFAQTLVAGGLTAVVDLRSPVEVQATGRGPLAKFPIAYHHLPLIADVASTMPRGRPALDHEAMGQMYVEMVRTAAPALVMALNVLAYSTGTTAFHCAAGRDRTGVLAAVLLLALGARDDDVVMDYARTGDNMAAVLERTQPVMGAMWQALGFDPTAHNITALLDGRMKSSMRLLLTTLRADYEDPLTPLRDAGLSYDSIARLRQRAIGR